MQDNLDQIFEKKFVDNSWDKMSGLLDASMPVAKAKRKDNRLVIVLALLLLAISFLCAYFAFKYNSIIPNATLTKEKVIYKNIYIPQEAKLNLQSDRVTRNNNTAKHAPLFEVGKLSTQNSNSSLDKVDLSFSNDKANISKLDVLEFQSLSSLPVSSIELEEEATHSDLFIEPFQAEEQDRRKLQYNIGVLSLVTNDFDFTGYGFTTGVEIPIGKKLGLATGVAVNFVSRDHYFLPHFPRADVINEESVLDAEASPYYEGLRNFKQVYLPIGLNYKVTNKLAVNSGVKLRYTYSETVENGLPIPPSPGRRMPPVANYDQAYNNTNIGVSAGLSLNVHDNFSILVDSEWGVGSIIKRTQLINPAANNYDLNVVNLTTNFKF